MKSRLSSTKFTLDVCFRATLDGIRQSNPEALITEPVKTTVAGAETLIIVSTQLENGVARRIVLAVAVRDNFLFGVVLRSTPERFEAAFPLFKGICDSSTLALK